MNSVEQSVMFTGLNPILVLVEAILIRFTGPLASAFFENNILLPEIPDGNWQFQIIVFYVVHA